MAYIYLYSATSEADFSRGTACAAYTGYYVRVTRVTRVGQSESARECGVSKLR